MKKLILFPALTILISCGLPGTGGGGGGDGTTRSPAVLALTASPSKIDAGEIVYTELFVQEVHEEGIVIKFKYHYGLDYIRSTAILETNRGGLALTPTHNESNSDVRYLTFFLERDQFGTDRKGTIRFQLIGRRRVANGNRIEVDADIENSTIADRDEFDISRPRFSAEDTTPVQVEN